MANELIYPFHIMRITQRYDGTTSHLPHMTGTPKEYALDEGGSDTGRDWVFCPCDKMKVVKLTGVRKPGTNAVYLTSTSPVKLANGKSSIVTLQLVHPNDDDLIKLKDGQIFRRGEKICREGNDGATGYHVHMAVGLGTIIGTGWQKNSKSRWVLVTTGGAIKPEDAFYIDPSFTTVKGAAGISFKKLSDKKADVVVYKTIANLKIRSAAGTKNTVVGQYAKGTKVSVSETGTVNGVKWGKTKDGWICLKYAKKVKA